MIATYSYVQNPAYKLSRHIKKIGEHFPVNYFSVLILFDNTSAYNLVMPFVVFL